MDRRRREPLNCVAGLLTTVLALTCVGVPAVAAPDSIQGSRMALSQAEMEMLQRQVALDLMAAIDAKDRCDLEAFNRIHDTLLTKLRLAAASITEMARLSQQMSLRLTEIAAELQRLLPPGVGGNAVEAATRVALLGAGAIPVVGNAISATRELAAAANEDAALRESVDIINRLQEQYEQILEVLRNAEHWQTLHDEIAEAISRAVTYQGGPCGPDDALPGDAERDAGAEVAKPGLSMTGGGGNPVETTMVRFPPDDDTDASVVAEDEVIDPDSTYVVDAQCHEPRIVAGRDLIRERGVRLRHTTRRFWFEPCESDAEALERVAEALAALGVDFDPRTSNYVIERQPPGCTVLVDDPPDATVTVAPGCSPAVIGTTGTPGGVADTGVPPGNDDPGVDDTPVTPIDPGVPVLESNLPSKPAQTLPDPPFPNDPFYRSAGTWRQAYPDQWGLHRIGFAPDSPGQARSLWPDDAEPVVVAVLDTGIDQTHPELMGAVWFNEREIPGNGLDDEGNGYVDDVYGWNFADGNNDVADLNGHGTVVAGIIAAWTDNGTGLAGVNPWARIMAVKIARWSGDAWNFDIADAIRYAADNGARVINVSFEGERLRRTEHLAVAYARSKGAIVVAAAGNSGSDIRGYSPGGLPGVVTVAATDVNDARAGFSNWGAGVDLSAPGVDILSLRARQTDLLKFSRDDYRAGAAIVGDDRGYYRLTGTSFAAPFVSGVASLILSMRPDLTDKQVTRMLMHTARDIETPGWDQYTGYGLLDAGAAVRADPDYYVLSRIRSVAGVQTSDGFVVQVTGRAIADDFGRAWIEIGQGGDPQDWIKVSEDLTGPIDEGLLVSIPAGRFAGSNQWTVRLIVEHANGSRREARFNLEVG